MLGLAGVYLVVRHKIALDGDPVDARCRSSLALVGISVGTLYQKRFCGARRPAQRRRVQFAACALLYAPIVACARAAADRVDDRSSSSRSAGR